MVWNSFEDKESCVEMDNEKSYNVVMNDFIAWGGNNYPDLREKKYKIRQGMQISINGNFHILLSFLNEGNVPANIKVIVDFRSFRRRCCRAIC